MRHLLKALPAILLLQPAFAAETDESLPKWGGSAELGSVWTTGNTSTSSINGKFNVERQDERWDSRLKLSALTSKEDKVTSKEKYSGLLQLDRNYTERTYLAIVGQQDRDRFSGFDYQGTVSVGLGYRAIVSKAMNLEFEVGPGYSREREKATATLDEKVNEEAVARLVANYNWKIRDGVEFIEEFSAQFGDDNNIYRSETGLKSQINGSLATKISYKVKYVSDVPADSKKRDGEFGVTLVYSF